MIAFVTTLRHPDDARSYDRISALLARTLRSVAAQTDEAIRVVVAGNRPPLRLPPPARFVRVDLPPTGYGPGDPDGGARARRDKGLKLVAGVAAALEEGPSHVMLLDADDLVHRGIAAAAAAAPDAAGWYVESGYAWWEGSGRVTLVRPFHLVCGSSIVVAARLLAPAYAAWDGDPARPGLDGRPLWSVLGQHTRIASFFAGRGEPLRPLPFPGAVWVRGTGENRSEPVGYLSLLGRPIDDELRRDFALDAPSRGLAAECALTARQAVATWRAARRRGTAYALRATVGRARVRLWQTLTHSPWAPRELPHGSLGAGDGGAA